MKRASLLTACALSLLSAVGCGPDFDKSNEIKTLRVLGVQKDKPYAQPGEEVKLQLLWHDPKGRTDVQRAFVGGCVNPAGDLFYACFPQFAELAAKGTLPFQAGDTFSVTLPDDIISSRRDEVAPGQPPNGLYIVFFAVCAGTLSFDMSASAGTTGSEGLPIRCLDDQGKPLGSDDFVVGYSSIYSFEDAKNTNPTFVVDGGQTKFEVAGHSLTADCVGAACQGTPPVEVDCDAEPERCVAACADDGDASCPDIEVKPDIEQRVELDDVSTQLFGTDTPEQMWVNYYVDHGGISEVRLVNDAKSGWNEKYRGELHAPKDAGPLQIWAVVHDNRGGMDFTRITLGVKK
ncbi:MAG TPA: hypothetical protein VEQ58_19285 [Polyangiaceae bacterium]|nr:hypothetical protein [Polyangiaceae bacterium]